MENVASILGLGGRGTGLSLYCASKGGVVNLTRDLAIELAPDIPSQLRVPGRGRHGDAAGAGARAGGRGPRIGVRGKLWRRAMRS